MDNKINHTNPNNIAFKSRIIFLSPKGFCKVKEKYKNKNFTNICHFNITDNEKDWWSCYKTNVKIGYTKGVRTCTAGICANKGKKASLFWHVENTTENIKQFPALTKLIKGTNAIIIGSKSQYKYSKELFEQFVRQINTKNIPTTIIQGTKNSEANLFYNSTDDTLFICLSDIYKKSNYVNSLESLQNTCDVVKISPNDTIEFYDMLPEESLMQKIKKCFNNIFTLQ